ncbi:periplasmic protein [Piscirickettsiaceae bacterium NZ-RLO1]|nr:periplasmic protein [Piscirickettsiaceae bacterium NZ-RLO1]
MKKLFFTMTFLFSLFGSAITVSVASTDSSSLTSSFNQSDVAMPPLWHLFRQLQLTIPQRQQLIGIIRGLREKNYPNIQEYNQNNKKLMRLTLSDNYRKKHIESIVHEQSKLFETITLNQAHANRKIYSILTEKQQLQLKDHITLLKLIDS